MIILVCAAVMGFSLYKIVSISSNYNQARDEYSALREYVTKNDTGDDGSGENNSSSGGGASATSGRGGESDEDNEKSGSGATGGGLKDLIPPVNVDHESLLAQNPDYRGWIYIEALPNISYPIMQSTDNDYYLHRTFDGVGLFAGSIFIDYQNKGDFSDPNTVVYGHNMKDDSMFGILQSMRDDALYEKSPYFWILTPQGSYKYKMFCMISTDIYSEAYTLFKSPSKEFADFIGRMKGISEVDTGDILYDENSKVVTLSTCISGQGPDRFLILGIRVNK